MSNSSKNAKQVQLQRAPKSLSLLDPFNFFLGPADLSAVSDESSLDGPPRFTPRIDLSETDKHLDVYVDLAGVPRDQIDIQLDEENNLLTISGESKSMLQDKDENRKWHRVERHYGQFVRQIRVPDGTDPASIKADHENGILHLSVQKREPPRKVSKIAIS